MTNTPATTNLLLSRFPEEAARGDVTPQRLKSGDVLGRAGERPEFLFFPEPGTLISLVRNTETGSGVEAGIVGDEGFYNVQALLTDGEVMHSEGVLQLGENVSRIRLDSARESFHSNEAFRDDVLAYMSTVLEQATQNTVCNRLHLLEQRLAKWLLLCRDRIRSEELPLTHEFISYMVGGPRSAVTEAAAELRESGAIDYRRGLIVIRDFARLQQQSCECYDALQVERPEPQAASGTA